MYKILETSGLGKLFTDKKHFYPIKIDLFYLNPLFCKYFPVNYL